VPLDETIFAGAATYYARYRVPYPPQLITDLVAHYGLDGRGRLLDLGCGPGTLTLPLAPHFKSVVALDIGSDMIEEARHQPREVMPIEWLVMSAEEVSPALGTFRLVTCGSSFHWMDRDLVLARVRELLDPGCGIALAAGISGWCDGPEDWHHTVTATIKRYLGDVRPSARYGQPAERFEETPPRNGWSVDLNRDYPIEHVWDIDSLIGHLWST
jgi:trans-aconitate methyltransferase